MKPAPVIIAAKVPPELKNRILDLAHARRMTVSALIVSLLMTELETEL